MCLLVGGSWQRDQHRQRPGEGVTLKPRGVTQAKWLEGDSWGQPSRARVGSQRHLGKVRWLVFTLKVCGHCPLSGKENFCSGTVRWSSCLNMHVLYHFQETINMFERNIIDLVGLFVENVQSLYPFLDASLRGGAAGRGALRARTTAPRLQGAGGRRLHFKQKAQKGTASSQLSRM